MAARDSFCSICGSAHDTGRFGYIRTLTHVQRTVSGSKRTGPARADGRNCKSTTLSRCQIKSYQHGPRFGNCPRPGQVQVYVKYVCDGSQRRWVFRVGTQVCSPVVCSGNSHTAQMFPIVQHCESPRGPDRPSTQVASKYCNIAMTCSDIYILNTAKA